MMQNIFTATKNKTAMIKGDSNSQQKLLCNKKKQQNFI